MIDQITLVIDAAALERMRIDEGSLLIKAIGRSEQRVPVARLQRIDVTGVPSCALDCLVELAERSVPVTFFGVSGSVRAQLFHPRPQLTSLSHWISELFSVAGESAAYRNWYENHLRAIYRAAGIRGGILAQQDREHTQLFLEQLRIGSLLETYASIVACQDGLVQARVGEHLLRFGLPPGGPGHARVAKDLEALCKRWILGNTTKWLERLGPSADAPEFKRYLRSLSSNAADEWLHLVLSRLTETAAAGALHHGTAAS